MNRAHYIQTEDGREIAFFPDTQRFFVVDTKNKEIIEDICALDKDAVIQKHTLTQDDYDRLVAAMTPHPQQTALRETDVDAYVKWSVGEPKVLGRWILHLANDCNLRCVYCYANGGNYHSDRNLMSKETLDRAIDVFYAEYDHMGLVQFFGGEPLLNMDLIEYGCERISEIERSRGYEPSFGVVTNGTLINDRFIEMARRYRMDVTVSYDGDPQLNDKMRPFPNGRGSSDIVLKNIQRLRDVTGQSNIESTYTKCHEDAGISILDVVKNTRELFPDCSVHISPFSGDTSCPYAVQDLSIFSDAIPVIVEESLRTGKPIHSFLRANQAFSVLSEKNGTGRITLCDAAVQKISVSTKGDIFPCFLFTDQEDMKLGSIWDENVFNSDFRKKVHRIMEYNFKPHHPECWDCIARYSCYHCIGIDSMENNGELKLSEKQCDMYRKMVTEAIKGTAKIYEKKQESANK
ncbi:MAG: radical SAM protein [Clostridia bacterium]|nr:radical SAM protein [Clostridia bacterium]